MTIDQLRYFFETAKTQHLNRAAQSLNISPSAVSAAIAALEDEYKCKLFDREGKRIRLTKKGQFLKDQAEKLFDHTNAIGLGMRGQNTDFSGTFKMAASHYLANHFLSKAWVSIQDKFPSLSVELGSRATHQVISDVLSGSLDGGLCISPLRHPDLKIIEIYQGQMYIAARSKHPIFKVPPHQQLKKISTYSALIHKPMVGVDICDNHPMFKKFGVNPNIRCFWDSDDVAIEILESSDSWTMLPDFVIETQAKTLKAIAVPPGWNAPVSVAFVFRSHRETTLAEIIVQELSDLFRDYSVQQKR